MRKVMQWLAALAALGAFTRFSAISFSLILPLLGAGTQTRLVSVFQIAILVLVALAFHVYAYVLNDVIDLPIDRTESLKAYYPLVRGMLRPWQALAIALAQFPLALLLSAWLAASWQAYGALCAAFLCMAIYNLWGKKIAFPLLTDFIQGLGWGAMVVYGAAIMAGEHSGPLAVVVSFIVVFILFINGVHGSLRDLANDFNCGLRTTAIMLGARVRDGDRLIMPPLLIVYALALQTCLFAILLLPLALNWFAYEPASLYATLCAVLITSLLNIVLLVTIVRVRENRRRLISIGMLHIIVSLVSLLLLFAAYFHPLLFGALVGVYFVPLGVIGLKRLIKGTGRKHA